MCLVVLAVGMHRDFPLIMLGNRDEFHARPTAPMHWWARPRILAGRDLEAGGTWLGVTRTGRVATVTNYRDPDQPTASRSRGLLVTRALTSDPADFRRHLEDQARDYGGYNLLWSDPQGDCWYHSNRRDQAPGRLPPGVYGLSNGVLDTPWPKLKRAREALREAIAADCLSEAGCFAILADRRVPADKTLPRTGVSLEWERLLSTAFIVSAEYGTRSSTLVMVRRNGRVSVEERGFDPAGRQVTGRSYWFPCTPA